MNSNLSLINRIYSTDASIYQIIPYTVLYPQTCQQISYFVNYSALQKKSLTVRGAGTSLVGQSIGDGIIFDLSKSYNKILEINVKEGWVSVEPGIVCSELNSILKSCGFYFAPDPATSNRATIGGMIANNAAGMRSVRYGMTIDHVIDIHLLLATGEELQSVCR